MEKITCTLLSLLIPFSLEATLFRPFPEGYAMGNLGTIFYKNSPAEFDLFSPSSLLTDTLQIGLSVSYTTYYDEMDNYQNLSISSLNVGTFASLKKIGLKFGASELNVFGFYKEQSTIFSTAFSLLKRVKISVELSGTRFLLNNIREEEWFTLADLGVSTKITFFYISILTKVEHIAKKYWRSSSNPNSPPLSFTLSIHTKNLNIGAQGISLKIIPEDEKPLSFALGMEWSIFNSLKVQHAIGDNPFLVALGVTILLRNGNTSFALVNHPVLGWSKGIALQYYKYLQKR